MTKQQIESLNKRLSMLHVKPVALYRTNNESIVLSCLNTNLNDPEPFVFVFYKNGNSNGKGYNCDLSSYELLFDFTSITA